MYDSTLLIKSKRNQKQNQQKTRLLTGIEHDFVRNGSTFEFDISKISYCSKTHKKKHAINQYITYSDLIFQNFSRCFYFYLSFFLCNKPIFMSPLITLVQINYYNEIAS